MPPYPTEETSLVDPLLHHHDTSDSTRSGHDYSAVRRRNKYDDEQQQLNNNSSSKRPLDSKNASLSSFASEEESSHNNNNNTRNRTSRAYAKQDVTYNGDNHLSVLFQMHGSVWFDVAPFCLASLLWTYVVIWLRRHHILDLTMRNANGHTFMSILVSFLVVTRASITYSRFMEARKYLADLFRASREVVQYTCLLTQLDAHADAVEWRQDVAYRTIVALRIAVCAVEFRSHGVNAWETLDEADHEHTELFLPSPTSAAGPSLSLNGRQRHRGSDIVDDDDMDIDDVEANNNNNSEASIRLQQQQQQQPPSSPTPFGGDANNTRASVAASSSTSSSFQRLRISIGDSIVRNIGTVGGGGNNNNNNNSNNSSNRDLSMQRDIHESARRYKPKTQHHHNLERLRHGPRSLMDENLRAPIVWAYNLREKILEHRIIVSSSSSSNGSNNGAAPTSILSMHPPHANEDLRWMALTSDWIKAFHGLKMLLTTPFPFPFVQMTRTFLFVWVFSLPLVLVADNDNTIEILIIMLFITYGFLGLEYVSMELDDPFGSDPNDFPVKRWAELVYEDIYLCVYKTDGFPSAMTLRSRISERMGRGSALDIFHEDMQNSQMDFFGTHHNSGGEGGGTTTTNGPGNSCSNRRNQNDLEEG